MLSCKYFRSTAAIVHACGSIYCDALRAAYIIALLGRLEIPYKELIDGSVALGSKSTELEPRKAHRQIYLHTDCTHEGLHDAKTNRSRLMAAFVGSSHSILPPTHLKPEKRQAK